MSQGSLLGDFSKRFGLKKETEKELEKDEIKDLVSEQIVEKEDIPKEEKEEISAAEKVIYDSFLGKILEDEGITDIGYNGTDLWVQHNHKGKYRYSEQPTKEEVKTLLYQIANVQDKEFTKSEPRLETEIGLLRVNAMHERVSPDGISFAIRVSRPRLAIGSIKDMTAYGSEDVEGLLRVLIKSGSNLVISGETGSGKTELQKLLVGYMKDNDKITLIEDTRDSHIKTLYPHKNIDSWQTVKSEDENLSVSIQDLVKSSLRNNPDWVIVAETRGAEAGDMLDAVKTGHSLITTLHADSAINIPSRFIPMIRQAKSYETISEHTIGREIADMLRFGVHLKLEFKEDGTVERGIKEIAEFMDYKDGRIVGNYKYREVTVYDESEEKYKIVEEFKPLSTRTINHLKESQLYHELPDVFKPKENKRKNKKGNKKKR